MSTQAWVLIFMMFILKVPIFYLGGVVWYAIKADPDVEVGPEESMWRPWRRPSGPRPRRGAPHGGGLGSRRAERARAARQGAPR